MINGIYDNSLV
jgi:hypothetical protein